MNYKSKWQKGRIGKLNGWKPDNIYRSARDTYRKGSASWMMGEVAKRARNEVKDQKEELRQKVLESGKEAALQISKYLMKNEPGQEVQNGLQNVLRNIYDHMDKAKNK